MAIPVSCPLQLSSKGSVHKLLDRARPLSLHRESGSCASPQVGLSNRTPTAGLELIAQLLCEGGETDCNHGGVIETFESVLI